MTDNLTMTTAGLVDALQAAQRNAQDAATRLGYATAWADTDLPRVQISTGQQMTTIDLTQVDSTDKHALADATTAVMEALAELAQAIDHLEAAADTETSGFQPRPPLTALNGGRRAAAAFARQNAAQRTRVRDDHKFSIDRSMGHTKCRVQLFDGGGKARPVAIVTQRLPGDGGSLMNLAESLAEGVWSAFLPSHQAPPIVVAYMLDQDGNHWTLDPQVYEYDVADADDHTVRRPVQWGPFLNADDLQVLVGTPVDLTR